MISTTEIYISAAYNARGELIPLDENPASLTEELCEQSMTVGEEQVVPEVDTRNNTPTTFRSGAAGDTINIHNSINIQQPVHMGAISRHAAPPQAGHGQPTPDPVQSQPPALVPYYQLQGRGVSGQGQSELQPPVLAPQLHLHGQGGLQPPVHVPQQYPPGHIGGHDQGRAAFQPPDHVPQQHLLGNIGVADQGQGGGHRAVTQDEYAQIIAKQQVEQHPLWQQHIPQGLSQAQSVSRPVFFHPRQIGTGPHHGNFPAQEVKPPQFMEIGGGARFLHDQETYMPHVYHSLPSDLQPRVFPGDCYGIPRNIHGAVWCLEGVENPSQYPALSEHRAELNNTLATRARCNAEQIENKKKHPHLMYPEGMAGQALISYVPCLTARTPYSAYYAKEKIPTPPRWGFSFCPGP